MFTSPFSLHNKKILITGASSGIGRSLAILASSMGAICAISGRNQERLCKTFSELSGTGHFLIHADISKSNRIEIVNQAVTSIGSLNGFVHCAGIEKTLPFRVTELSDLREIMAINLEAYWEITQEILKRKNHEQGSLSIVAISSVAAAAAGKTAYSASKGALISLTKSLAAEYAPKKVRFNCVSPGYIDTPMLQNVKSLYKSEDDFNSSIVEKHPLGLGTPGDAAGAIIYLLSDASKWITGSILTVDGGYGVR